MGSCDVCHKSDDSERKYLIVVNGLWCHLISCFLVIVICSWSSSLWSPDPLSLHFLLPQPQLPPQDLQACMHLHCPVSLSLVLSNNKTITFITLFPCSHSWPHMHFLLFTYYIRHKTLYHTVNIYTYSLFHLPHFLNPSSQDRITLHLQGVQGSPMTLYSKGRLCEKHSLHELSAG